MQCKALAYTLALTCVSLATLPAHAQHAASDHATHTADMAEPSAQMPMPTEGGQAGFTAIAEIVVLLNADPDTDWSKVSIDALRAHLVDMNELTLNASVTHSLKDDEIIFNVTGQGRTLGAIQAMIPAHAGVLTAANLYNVAAETTPTGATMQVRFSSKDEMQQIMALGFFGLMATGAHHQQHHLEIARGSAHVHS